MHCSIISGRQESFYSSIWVGVFCDRYMRQLYCQIVSDGDPKLGDAHKTIKLTYSYRALILGVVKEYLWIVLCCIVKNAEWSLGNSYIYRIQKLTLESIVFPNVTKYSHCSTMNSNSYPIPTLVWKLMLNSECFFQELQKQLRACFLWHVHSSRCNTLYFPRAINALFVKRFEEELQLPPTHSLSA